MRHLFAFRSTASDTTADLPSTPPYARQVCQDPVKLIPRVLRSSLPFKPAPSDMAQSAESSCATPLETAQTDA